MNAWDRVSRTQGGTGLAWGLAAYLMWGFVVLYFKAVSDVPPLEVLAHRVVWSMLLLGLVMGFRGQWKKNLATAFKPRALLLLSASTCLIAVNWFTFIWAVGHDQTLQASLGYYINPLVNVLLGFVFLRERLRPTQWLAVALACAAVFLLVLQMGRVPVVALVLAFSFGLYGLLRKVMPVDSVVGLTVEIQLLLPVAVGYLAWLWGHESIVFAHQDLKTDILLSCAGFVTAVPLLCFASAARRLGYATVGLLQYIAPTLQFVIAVRWFGEPLTRVQLMSFGMIWVGLVLYTADAWRGMRAVRALKPA